MYTSAWTLRGGGQASGRDLTDSKETGQASKPPCQRMLGAALTPPGNGRKATEGSVPLEPRTESPTEA